VEATPAAGGVAPATNELAMIKLLALYVVGEEPRPDCMRLSCPTWVLSARFRLEAPDFGVKRSAEKVKFKLPDVVVLVPDPLVE
jgi:hypothetical protein